MCKDRAPKVEDSLIKGQSLAAVKGGSIGKPERQLPPEYGLA